MSAFLEALVCCSINGACKTVQGLPYCQRWLQPECPIWQVIGMHCGRQLTDYQLPAMMASLKPDEQLFTIGDDQSVDKLHLKIYRDSWQIMQSTMHPG